MNPTLTEYGNLVMASISRKQSIIVVKMVLSELGNLEAVYNIEFSSKGPLENICDCNDYELISLD
jgi:hypothetical protein